MHQYLLVTLPSSFCISSLCLIINLIAHLNWQATKKNAAQKCRSETFKSGPRCADGRPPANQAVALHVLSEIPSQKRILFHKTFRQRRPPTAKDGNRKPYGRLRPFILPVCTVVGVYSAYAVRQKLKLGGTVCRHFNFQLPNNSVH
jgi:hypothetical protein